MITPAPRRSRPVPPPRRALAALGLALAALACGCRAVPDRVTGVDAGAHGVHASAACVRRCAAEYHESRRAERGRHLEARRACGRDDGCRRGEQLRHRRRLDELEQARRRCLRACYDEGDGRGGR
jgi:hypothetical protein